MRSIVCVLGSGRPSGNSATMAKRLLERAESLGARTQVFLLDSLTFKGCAGCMSCKTYASACVRQDDLTEVLAAVRDADVLVLTSPIYFGQISGQLKCFIDRMYGFLHSGFQELEQPSRLLPGKKCVFIITQQARADKYDIDLYVRKFRVLGYDSQVILGRRLLEDDDILGRAELLAEADAAADMLAR